MRFSFNSIMSRIAAALLFVFVFTTPAAAHPLPTGRYDRTVAVRLSPEGVTVTYTLEVTWFALWLDWARALSPEEIGKLDKTERSLAAACARPLGAEIATKLHATANGQPLTFHVEKVDIDVLDHARYRFTLRADWPPGGTKRAFAVFDDTFRGKPGILNLSLDAADAPTHFRVDVTDEPPPKYRNSPLPNTDPDEARKAAADVELPHEIGDTKPARDDAPEVIVSEGERPSLVADLWQRGLPALFNSPYGMGALLLAAFLFGAAHAFTPGHGKTLVAAYLVGERGTVGHAVILAVATTVAHTGSVIVIALILWSAYGNDVPGTTQGVLQFLGGFLVAGVGLWLFLRRVTGKADHFHLFAGHHRHHDHDHGHEHHHRHGPSSENAKSTAGWVRLVLMGLGGGMIPCWDAVLLLLAAIALNRVGFGIPLLFSFSAGLGAVLVMLGVGVVYAHRAGATKFAESRWFQYLPVVSAVLLIAVGFWLCQEGLRAAVK
jgi:nickel/cobalt transporter (NicO) family protein